MQYFCDTTETIPSGLGFLTFGPLHLLWLGFFAVLTLSCCLCYRKMGMQVKNRWRKLIALLLIMDELFKQVCLIAFGRWLPSYLPLHLCSINIFLITYHAWKPNAFIGNFLYTVCIPGAAAALLFPSWSSLPLGNFMHIHSFTVHLLLAMYPIVLAVAGDIRPDVKQLPKCLLALAVLAGIMWLINPWLDANFFFMKEAGSGNPLEWFEINWGNHLYGFPILVSAIIIVMHGPVILYRKLRRK